MRREHEAARPTITAKHFASLAPYDRGYVVYMCGARDDEPQVPDEKNPYPAGSADADAWRQGQRSAALTAQDSEE